MKGYLLLFLFDLITSNYKCKNFGSSQYSNKKDTLEIICKVLLEKGYETSFVAGILGNIYHEGSIGKFEISTYKNEEKKPQYLKDMDELYNYTSKYSGKFIYDVSLKEVKELLEILKADKWEKGKFGLGCIQWTGERTYTLVQIYNEECGNKANINLEQATAAEGKMIIQELSTTYSYVYKAWSDNTYDKSTSLAAYNAASLICINYEKPKDADSKAFERGITAMSIYEIMATSKNDGNINSSEKCQCYMNIIENNLNIDDKCFEIIIIYLNKEVCPLFEGVNATEKEIEECEMNYFCGNDDIDNGNKYINLSYLILFTLIIY